MDEQEFSISMYAVATAARKKAALMAQGAYRAAGHQVDRQEFKTISESAAYLAFISLGGDPDNPQMLDQRQWIDETYRNLAMDLDGKQSPAWDYRARVRGRKMMGVEVQEFMWDAWKGSAVEDRTGVRVLSDDLVPESQTVAGILQQDLMHDLAKVLMPSELYMVVQHYICGRTQRELAQELVNNNAELQADPDGEAKARARVNSVLRRGRVRAAEKLDKRWRFFAQEVA